jgi:hypothetical protein
MEDYKDLPYGIADFKDLVQRGFYYVDKTPFIKTMDRTQYLILLRPRRFGKSLFLSTLRYYYDIAERDNFHAIFKDTWIADNPTSEQGTYQVLSLDFSMISGELENVREEFSRHCCNRIDDFMKRYKSYYDEDDYKRIVDSTDFADKLEKIQGCARRSDNIRLCLLVDEYDNFTNTILATKGHDVYHKITHADGFYRDVFKKFKAIFQRIVLTGVSPVTLDDLTSGFNIARNVTQFPEYNSVLGFSTEEVLSMVHYYQKKGLLPADDTPLMKEMTEWYDGYCFSEDALESGQKIYNSTMVINYLQNYVEKGHAPKSLLDINTRTDYAKLHQLLHLDQLNGDRKSVLMEIVQNGYTYGKIEESFPAHRLTDPMLFTSLLFYYGMLTITGVDGLDPILGIPNNNVRKQYYDYLAAEYNQTLPIRTSIMKLTYKSAALEGKWREMMEFLCGAYHEYSSIRSAIEGERNVQGFLLAYLSMNPYYLTAPEVEVNHGYCDFFLMPEKERIPSMMHSYIVELKYLPSGETEAKAEAQWQEAVDLIHKYMQAPKVHLLSKGTTLHGIVLQVKGTELYRTEEVEQLDISTKAPSIDA